MDPCFEQTANQINLVDTIIDSFHDLPVEVDMPYRRWDLKHIPWMTAIFSLHRRWRGVVAYISRFTDMFGQKREIQQYF